jgi:hypothetical protein
MKTPTRTPQTSYIGIEKAITGGNPGGGNSTILTGYRMAALVFFVLITSVSNSLVIIEIGSSVDEYGEAGAPAI